MTKKNKSITFITLPKRDTGVCKKHTNQFIELLLCNKCDVYTTAHWKDKIAEARAEEIAKLKRKIRRWLQKEMFVIGRGKTADEFAEELLEKFNKKFK